MEQKRRKIGKGKVKKLKMEGSFFFSFLLFTFENHRNLFWIYQNVNFLKAFHARKKIWKNDFAPSKKIFPLRPCLKAIPEEDYEDILHEWIRQCTNYVSRRGVLGYSFEFHQRCH